MPFGEENGHHLGQGGRHFGFLNAHLFGFVECFKTCLCQLDANLAKQLATIMDLKNANYYVSVAAIHYLDKCTCENGILF